MVAASAVVDELHAAGREGQKSFLRYMLHFLRELMNLSWHADSVRLNAAELQLARRLQPLLPLEKLQLLHNLVNASAMEIERNASAKILFFHRSIQIMKLLHTAGPAEEIAGSYGVEAGYF
jgi:hypothetical protein